MEREIPRTPLFFRIACVVTCLFAWAFPLSIQAQCLEAVGDLNETATVDVTDVQCAILSVLSELTPTPDESLLECVNGDVSIADVNCDSLVNIIDVLVTLSKALNTPLPFPSDSNGNGCPTLCDAPSTDVGMPEVLWQLLDYQPESSGFNTVYGPGQIAGVTVIVLLDGG
jgi:hypothetical protein